MDGRLTMIRLAAMRSIDEFEASKKRRMIHPLYIIAGLAAILGIVQIIN